MNGVDDILCLGSGDISVGRRHATITVGKPTMQSVRMRGEHTKLIIRDLSSKHGVYVDKERIEPAQDVEVIIKEDHLWTTLDNRHIAGRGYGGYVNVKIGDMTSFRLERVDWSLCSQALTAQAKVGIVGLAAEIDCKVEESWVPGASTHLIVGKANRSEKLYLALAEGGYLVNTDWLKAVEASFKDSWDSKGLKDAQTLETSYPAPVPAIFQHSNVRWTPTHTRRKLFRHHRFISVTKAKYQNVDQVIRCAGGDLTATDAASSLKLINECLTSTMIPVFLQPHKEEEIIQSFSKLDSILNRMGYRWVREDEIGMAIISASTERYCNPKYLEPLQAMEVMASLHSTQLSLNDYSSTEEPPVSTASTLSRSGSTVGFNKEAPRVIDSDNDNDLEASLSFSQLMAPTKKFNRTGTIAATKPQETTKSESPKPPSSQKPAKKKTKTDRMAMFFDGLEDDENVIGVDTSSASASVADSHGMTSNASSSVLVESTDSGYRGSELGEQIDTDESVNIIPAIDEKKHYEESQAMKNDKAEELIQKEDLETKPMSRITAASTKDDTAIKVEPKSQSLSLSTKASSNPSSSSRRKPSTFDGVREDMMALKLDTKVGRQKDFIDEKERQKLLEVQRLDEKAKGDRSKLMQSEWSENLTKSKRRKLGKKKEGDPPDSLEVSRGTSREDRSASIQILSEADKKDWSERWKSMPNFKAFRKATVAGVRVKSRGPTPLMLDGEIVVKHEETIKKIGQYLKREPKEPTMPSVKPLRKKGEAQMAKDDIKILLANE
ncbi:hypothetical protein BCR41DRAFT_399051 [Lobosporangium transversale]|uniref:FHA domain-containing protein n=1 Tax=Lobosporangium transversale TaxID=64571 RepID=A0A1Y2GEN1_9FUNG|nr:hypothetical protein BCR41DRAFT_399051 [Lobosporangium transversale]ORZ08784.1 hypothetical protein BCR41DRAFT_399051 [Lobosporangium transversale]|eukprot:XP_021878567.1 hypothetical protein BCR41DRAFT_399051 [Lobosporangium transversale]